MEYNPKNMIRCMRAYHDLVSFIEESGDPSDPRELLKFKGEEEITRLGARANTFVPEEFRDDMFKYCLERLRAATRDPRLQPR